MNQSGLIVVVSGPGGVGKSTVVKRLVGKYERLWLSRSWTTRERRDGEDSNAYVFVSEGQFLAHVESGGFLEHTNFLGNYYGTPMPDLSRSEVIVLEIEVDGARQVSAKYPDALLIFLQAPSDIDQLERLRNRGDSLEKIQARIDKSAEEKEAGAELGAHLVINNNVEGTVDEIWQIIEKERANRTGGR